MTAPVISAREQLRAGVVIPAHPLALTPSRTLDERRQRALTRYYMDAGAGGVAVGVHTTQFAIREPRHGMYRPVLTLAADRDRLTARLASLERNLDDMTGSIKRQATLAAAAPKAPAPAAPTIAPLAMPASTDTAATWPGTAQTQAAAATPDPVPLPPTRVAAAPASEPVAEPPRKPEFGVDLGGAPTMDVLSARWAAVKANFGPLLTGLHPLATHDRRPGSTDFRLLVGPLPTAAAATQLCARFVAARVTCRTAKFDGQRLAQQ